MKKVLFLCTGNYYRSRFAEHLFDNLAKKENLSWRAFSRGLNVVPGKNHGPLSVHTITGLKSLQITLEEAERLPMQVAIQDLEEASLVVAVKKVEHEPLILKNFLAWKEKIIYWTIHDIDYEDPEIALRHLKKEVESLVEKLKLHS